MAKETKETKETKEIRRYIKLTFIEPVLGTWPSNENVARDFIASKAPDASTIKFGVTLADPAHEALLKEWLDNGFFRGLGQWRNSGKGRFVYKMLDEEGNNLGGTEDRFDYMMQEANFFPEEKAG